MNVLRAGDRAWLVELADNDAARRVARRLATERLDDVVPGHCTVLAVGELGRDELRAIAERALADELDDRDAKSVVIPVVYDGPDLGEVARLTGLDEGEVVARHTAPEYSVAFLGFAPGFGYLVGGDPQLTVPRRADPRERVPAGSVAIAGPYSRVHPRGSPGGWRLPGPPDVTPSHGRRRPPPL